MLASASDSPGFNGAKTVVTINSVKSLDLATTYTVTTDYTVAVDSVTGISHLVHVSTGAIPLNTDIVVDMDKVDFLDSTGLGVLVGGLKRVKSNEGELRLVVTQDRIMKIFDITGLSKVFPIHGSLDEALQQA